jgi:putative redox protein
VEVKLNWHGRMSFTAMAETDFSVPLGAKPDVGGDNDGFRPMELIAVGLGGCTAMDVIAILSKKRQDITNFEVQVHAERAIEHPKVFTYALIEYHVTGHNVKENAVLRSIELSATRYCPAQAMFAKLMPIDLKYHIYEDQGDGKRTLVSSGVYTYTPQKEQPT